MRLPFRRRQADPEIVFCRACQQPTKEFQPAHGRQWYRCPVCGFIQARITERTWDLMLQGEGFAAGTGAGGGGYREYWISTLCYERLGFKDVLLYGTGNTPTLKILLAEGRSVVGSDFSRDLVAARQSEHGAGAFAHPDNLTGKFDAIVAVEVFEHLLGPLATFSFFRQHLNPLGVIAGTTDFYDGTDLADHVYLKPRLHVAYWSEKSLTIMAGRLGLELALFELECPGSVTPDEKYGLLWPRKRVFFLFPSAHRKFFEDLKRSTPILPINRP